MGCIPFCCCCKRFKPIIFCYIALAVNVIKLLLSVVSFFLLQLGEFFFGYFYNGFEILFVIANLAFLSIIAFYLRKGKEKFKCVKILCIISMIFSGLILLFHFLGLILGIIVYKRAKSYISRYGTYQPRIRTSDWIAFIVPWIVYFSFEIVHFLAINYLYKLMSVKSFDSYEEYLKRGENVEQVSVTSTEINVNQNPPNTQQKEVTSNAKI